jgi:hypothetical protein
MTFRTLGIAVILSFAFRLQSLAEDPASANREAIVHGLRALAVNAQRYYWTPGSEGGGGGSFANMILGYLLIRPSNVYGYFALSSPTATSVTLTGTGRELGYDGTVPVEVEAIVYPDSVNVTITN